MLTHKNILIVVAGDLASNYVTAIHPLLLLQKTYVFKFDVFNIKDVSNRKVDISKYNLVIFIRIIMEPGYKLALELAKRKIPLIYIFDDDFETLDNVYIMRLQPALYMPRICELATSVIVTADTLYHKYKNFSKHINVIGDYLDLDEFASFNIMKNYTSNNILKIGYASSDHNYNNLKIVLPALLKILSKYPQVVFESFFKNKIKELNGLQNITYLQSIPNIYDYYKFVSSRNWDIGLAPLELITFNESKSDLKYREYASLKIPGIYSNMPPYKNVNENGILCNINEWENKIEELITNPAKRLEIAKKAYYNISQILNKDNVQNMYLNIFKHCFGVAA